MLSLENVSDRVASRNTLALVHIEWYEYYFHGSVSTLNRSLFVANVAVEIS